MSKVDNNPLLQKVSGLFGNTMIFRTVRGQQQMVNRPKKRRKNSEKQLAVREKFQSASQYAQRQIADPDSLALYKEGVTQIKHTPYIVAMSDYLNAPKVQAIDKLAYTGKTGDKIVVHATDDFRVMAVKIRITDGDENVLETGDAGPDPNHINQWVYTATKDNPSVEGTIIRAVAYDKPGNTGQAETEVQGF